MQIMNLYCTAVSVIDMPSIMSMIVITIPLGIPLMVIPLMLMIPISFYTTLRIASLKNGPVIIHQFKPSLLLL